MPDRIVVAISEDRQWLVVQGRLGFQIFRLVDTSEHYGYFAHDWRKDIGQSADEVLREFLERRS